MLEVIPFFYSKARMWPSQNTVPSPNTHILLSKTSCQGFYSHSIIIATLNCIFYNVFIKTNISPSQFNHDEYESEPYDRSPYLHFRVHVVSDLCGVNMRRVMFGDCAVLGEATKTKTGPPSSLILVSGQGWPNLHDQGSDKCHHWTGASHLSSFISR